MLPQIHSWGLRKWVSWKFQKTIVHGSPIFSRCPLSFYINLCKPGECHKMHSIKNTSDFKWRRHSCVVLSRCSAYYPRIFSVYTYIHGAYHLWIGTIWNPAAARVVICCEKWWIEIYLRRIVQVYCEITLHSTHFYILWGLRGGAQNTEIKEDNKFSPRRGGNNRIQRTMKRIHVVQGGGEQ